MENTFDKAAEKLMPIANAIGSQKHLQAVRNGLLTILPLTIVGSMFTIIMNLPIESYMEWIAPYSEQIGVPFRYTVGLMSVYVAFAIGSHLGESYNLSKTMSGILSVLGTMLLIQPINLSEGLNSAGIEVASGRYIPMGNLGSSGLFGAIIASLISVEIYNFTKKRNLEIRMPEGVPPLIAESFAALLPTLFVILLFWIPTHFLGFDLNGLLTLIVSPLRQFMISDNLFGGVLTQFVIMLFWSFGIHGHAVLGPIIRPLWDGAIFENAELFQNGMSEFELPNIFTEQFFQWYAQMGGSGATLAFVVLCLFSKSSFLKQLGKVSIIPGIFNINEPVIFGAPLVMNPLLIIPFILAPVANTILIYIVTILDFMPRMIMKPPFSIPAPIGALLTTNFNWFAVLMTVVSFFLSMAIYYPFFKAFEKQQLVLEKEGNEDLDDLNPGDIN